MRYLGVHLLLSAILSLVAQPTPPHTPALWIPGPGEAGQHVGFRGAFELRRQRKVEIRLLGASWFNAWIDGNFLAEGPARYDLRHREYESVWRTLSPGRHVLSIEVVDNKVPTRLMKDQPPFVWAEVDQPGEGAINLAWKAIKLPGYEPSVRRINPQLGWIEWCDTRQLPDWKRQEFDDSSWAAPTPVLSLTEPPSQPSIANVSLIPHRAKPIAEGLLAETFGYEQDDPATRFYLRDLMPKQVPAQGVWRRYDLGHVGLWRPDMTIDSPPGSIIEFAYSESLKPGNRVRPWITLSGGPSCNLNHYVARGGSQTFRPLEPRGGRYVEVHVLAPPKHVRFLDETFLQRTYYPKIEGRFESGDPLLDQIWKAGATTLQSCSEDALIDNPTRERGQWSGDLGVGLNVAAASMNDLRLMRRGLVQAAECARADGLVSGMSPGQDIYVADYAALWPTAVMRYFVLTGDRTVLDELYDAAERNMAAFERVRTPAGIPSSIAWTFIDWGYVPNEGPCDMALNLDYLDGLEALSGWSWVIGNQERSIELSGLISRQRNLLRRYFDALLAVGKAGWERVGYHRAVLGLRLRFFKSKQKAECIAFIKRSMLRCFPNDVSAPRLADPGVRETRLITPYFAHFSLAALFENGQSDFALGQIRKCWGWGLQNGWTTVPEVFDSRWSLCHQWSACPTWQLSQYVLGLRPRFDLAEDLYGLSLKPGSLRHAQGRLPMRKAGQYLDISWARHGEKVSFSVKATAPVRILLPNGSLKRLVPNKVCKLELVGCH